MKKSLFALFALGLTACEDVPAPYEILTGDDTPGNIPVLPAARPEGDGTAATPWNVAAANLFDPGEGVTTTEEYYVRGRISQLKEYGDGYGNYTYYISDDGSTKDQYYVYRGYALGGEKFTAADNLAVGDSVVICGKIVNFKGTLEFAQGNKLVYLNGRTPDVKPEPEIPTGDAEMITVADFIDKADVNTVYRLRGVVSNISSTLYGNFDLVDATGSIYIYGLLTAAGEAKMFESLGIAEGDTLTLQGKYLDYQGKPEIKDALYVSHVKGQSGGNDTPGENPGENPGGDTPDVPVVSSIQNGDFELWTDGLPDHWITKSTAGNAKLSQSEDAHGGKYSVLVKGDTQNKRLAYEETTFEAGTYEVTFYAKSLGGATGTYGAQCRPGYATFNADGTINSSGYKYSDHANLKEGEWVKVTSEFTLEAKQQICPLIMNPKNCGDMLIDDYTITKK